MLSSRFFIVFSLLVVLLGACSGIKQDLSHSLSGSNSKVTDVAHTPAKTQSIGNCWLYASIAMAESLVLTATNGEVKRNFSETYITYFHFRNQLLYQVGVRTNQVNAAGNFETARNLIKEYGLLEEGEFIANEANAQKSNTQIIAQNKINLSLANGPLNTLLTNKELTEEEKEELIDVELQKIFSIDIKSKMEAATSGDSILVKSTQTGEMIPLNEELYNWETQNLRDYVLRGYWYVPAPNIPVEELNYDKEIELTEKQKNIFKTVKAALNDKLPVLISWEVEDNALKNAVYDINHLKERGRPGTQGPHLTILEDYTSKGVNPETGEEFYIGEGDASEEEKRLALEHGNIEALITKNSWGRYPGYTMKSGDEYGYHKLNRNYLLTWIKRLGSEDTVLPLRSFLLPKSYIKRYLEDNSNK